MKTYVFTLTDEAKVLPKEFVETPVSIITAILVAKGGFDIQYLAEIGCITASFASEQNFEPIDGVLAIEESVECTTQN